MVQSILSGEWYCAKKVGALCANFVYTGDVVKNWVDNGLHKPFKLLVQNFDASYQAMFIHTYVRICDKDIKKVTMGDQLTEYQSQLGQLLYFLMIFHPYQTGPKCNYICMASNKLVQLPLHVGRKYDSINNQMHNTFHELLAHIVGLYHGRKLYIVTIKKYMFLGFLTLCVGISLLLPCTLLALQSWFGM